MSAAAQDVACVHVACIGVSGVNEGCFYQPPSIGPELPRQVRDSVGGLWTNHGGHCYYLQLPADHPSGRRYEITTWGELQRLARGEQPVWTRSFPSGPWEVSVA